MEKQNKLKDFLVNRKSFSNRKDGKCYVFLDEIQMLNNWQEACKTIRLYNNSIFITGSNSKLLSKNLSIWDII